MSTSTLTSTFTVPTGAEWVPASEVRHANYRGQYDTAHCQNLASDIVARGLQTLPIVTDQTVSPWLTGPGYLAVSGNTRIVVMRDLLSCDRIPVEVRGYVSERDMLDEQVRENELRREVDRIDRVRIAMKYRDEHRMSSTDIGTRMSLTATQVGRLLTLGDRLSVRALETWSTGLLLDGQASELCRVDRDRQDSVIDLCKSRRFSVRAFEQLIDRIVEAQIEDAQTGIFEVSAFALQLQDMAADVTDNVCHRPTRRALEAQIVELQRKVTEMANNKPIGPTAALEWANKLVFPPKRAYALACIAAAQTGAPWPTAPNGEIEWATKVHVKLAKLGLTP